MQRLEVSGAVRPIYGSLGFKRLSVFYSIDAVLYYNDSEICMEEFIRICFVNAIGLTSNTFYLFVIH